ncbi:MAG: helix-turn-helix transcriptional regulator [Tannerella sp.]|jgi:AraC-like DNA-binding protein|nr:helix-turn-helix transcriptional regulator [Tannerella sp.]
MIADLLRDLKEYKDALVLLENFQNDVVLMEFDHLPSGLDANRISFPAPARHGGLIFIGVMKGEMTFSIDYITHRVRENGILWILPTHIAQLVHITQDFKCWALLLSKSLLEENGHSSSRSGTPLIPYMQLKKTPFCMFEPEEFRTLYGDLQVLLTRMKQKTHVFYREIVVDTLKIFFLDTGNFFFSRKENIFSPVLTRREEIFANFLKLLSKHCTGEHEVSFYADKLCITPQYLSLVLKEESGRSASLWIQEGLMVEAKGLLKMPVISVQEVANRLHFPDQSTFGKFFKKHAGLSPVAFQKAKNASRFPDKKDD